MLGPATVTYNGTVYYYLRNAQGDITGIVNSSGTQVVDYSYEAWGVKMTRTGTMQSTLGTLNPFRYRGYVYDEETELYYLKSRYYKPAWGRFINADSPAVATISPDSATWDKNLFAYCDNNPIKREDDEGRLWVETVLVGGIVGAAIGGINAWVRGGDATDILLGITAGAVAGALTAAGGSWLYYGAAVSGVYKACTSEGTWYNKLAKGLTAFGSTLMWGYFGSVSGAETVLENSIIDIEFGVAAEGAAWISDQLIDTIFPDTATTTSKTPSASYRKGPYKPTTAMQHNVRRELL